MALNPQNLKDIRDLDPEKARQIRSMGGKAASEKLRQKRSLREAFFAIQELDVEGTDGSKKAATDAIALALVRKCIKGDLKAIELLWEALYGKQAKVDVTSSDGSMSPQKVDLGDRTTEELMQMFKALGDGGDGQRAS